MIFPAKLSAQTHRRLASFLEQQRHIYNAALEERIGCYKKTGKARSFFDQCKGLTELRTDPEFAQYDVEAQRTCLTVLHKSFQGFFRRVKAGQKPGFPRFKGRHRGCRSLTFLPRLKQKGRYASLSVKGIGRFRFKCAVLPANITSARIVRTPRRVTIQLIVKLPNVEPNPQAPLGIDVGITNRVTLSSGKQYPKNTVDRREVERRQRRLSHAKKRSRNRAKKRMALAKAWQRARERERGKLHELTAALLKETNCFVVEDLHVAGMVKNHALARSIMEQQWDTFIAMLTYKAVWAGGWVRKVDPKYTSQDCSACGARVVKNLKVRLHSCPHCGLTLDRDVNAARNILARGGRPRLRTSRQRTVGRTAAYNALMFGG